MEDASKDQPAPPAITGKSKLRYPLRSASKSKEEKSPVAEISNSSVSKRGRPPSSVSKSMNVLDLSGKEKSAKPPRRLSIPAKAAVTPVPKTIGNITPISEVRARRSVNGQGISDTPVSEVSTKSGNRRKFSVLSSSSYWLSQIKLSESAAKHSISIGFFKLALEAGCEPLQRLRDELKSYARRHNLIELGEPVKELFDSYSISENLEQLQVSETCSHVPEEGTKSSDDDVHSSSPIGNRKLKPKSLNTDAVQASSVTESTKEENIKKNNSATRVRGSWNKNAANTRSASETVGRNLQKKPQKPIKQESNKGKEKIKKQGKKPANEEVSVDPLLTEETLQEENKENMDAPPAEEIILTEVV